MPTLEGGLDLKLNLTQILDGYAGLEHTLPIMPLYKDVVQLVAQSGIVYTPTLLVQYGGPWAENYFYENDRRARRHEAAPVHAAHAISTAPCSGGRGSTSRSTRSRRPPRSSPTSSRPAARSALGGHGQRQGIQCHWELWAIASGGMSNHDVLKVGTIFGAEAIGLGKDLGIDREGQARRSRRARPQPAREHPEHEHDPLRDEERRALRRRHARSDLAAAEEAAASGTGGISSRRCARRRRTAPASRRMGDRRSSSKPTVPWSVIRVRVSSSFRSAITRPVVRRDTDYELRTTA